MADSFVVNMEGSTSGRESDENEDKVLLLEVANFQQGSSARKGSEIEEDRGQLEGALPSPQPRTCRCLPYYFNCNFASEYLYFPAHTHYSMVVLHCLIIRVSVVLSGA
jgi:hypothetical protein